MVTGSAISSYSEHESAMRVERVWFWNNWSKGKPSKLMIATVAAPSLLCLVYENLPFPKLYFFIFYIQIHVYVYIF